MSAPTTRTTWREPVESHVTGDFRHRAACGSVDPEVFFPVAVSGRRYATRVRIAKAVCAGCPVREACLSWALSAPPEGIAGGMTEEERRTERGRRSPGPPPPRRHHEQHERGGERAGGNRRALPGSPTTRPGRAHEQRKDTEGR